jgi:hypothetical protein
MMKIKKSDISLLTWMKNGENIGVLMAKPVCGGLKKHRKPVE